MRSVYRRQSQRTERHRGVSRLLGRLGPVTIRYVKVLLASSFHYPRGGDSIQFLAMARALTERGHEVAVFAMHHPDNLPSPWSKHWSPYMEYEGGLSNAARLTALWRSSYYPEAGRRLTALVNEFRPDIVHFHSVHHHLTVSVVDAIVRAGIPTVWTLHDYRTVCPATALLRSNRTCELCRSGAFWHCVAGRCKRGSLQRSIAAAGESYLTRLRGTLGRVTCYISPSRFLAGKSLEMGLPAARMEVLPNPISHRVSAPSNARRGVLYVGRLSAEKGVDLLIRACSEEGHVPLRIIGDGPSRPTLERLAMSLGRATTFNGWTDSSTVAVSMSEGALLCVPSIWYENCPGVVLEAMASGLPVVASDLGGLSELLAGGRCGLLFPAGDGDALRETLRMALASPGVLKPLADRARHRAMTRHGEKQFYSQLERIYASLM